MALLLDWTNNSRCMWILTLEQLYIVKFIYICMHIYTYKNSSYIKLHKILNNT